MTVFLGDAGRIQLQRRGSDQYQLTSVDPADVREDIDRFSVDFAHESIITGDRIEIRTVDKTNITWIDHEDVTSSFARYVHVDAAGGIRMYDTFSDAIKGDCSGAISLKKPDKAQECTIQISSNTDERCLAEVLRYEITTNRETIDTTNLGAHYRKQYEAGLIQGQGQIECFFRKNRTGCDVLDGEDLYDSEFSTYLARLCIRLVSGAAFHGWFYVYSDTSNNNRSVWYESENCIVTNVAVTVSPNEAIQATIEFVTSGAIALREGYIPFFLEQEENDDQILLEDSVNGRIELENAEIC